MKTTQTLLAACVWITACLPIASGQGNSSGAEVKLTCFSHDETISRHASYPVTWSIQNLPPNTLLSIRLSWTTQDSGVRVGGVPQKGETSRMIGGLLDATAQKRFMALSPSAKDFPTIDSGKYTWDVEKFCTKNTDNHKSVCDAAARYRLQVILRAADDPCGDNLQCAKPRALFKVYSSEGTIAFRD